MPDFNADVFIRKLEPHRHYDLLFESLTDVAYFAKDAHGRFVKANAEFVRMLGAKGLEGLIGKTDRDFFPAEVAARFIADDQAVMAEPVPSPDRTFLWRGVTKVPLRDVAGQTVGVAGISYKIHGDNATCHPGVFAAMDYIGKHYGKSVTIAELARLAGLSPRAFERHFARTFKTSPLRYLASVRLRAARHLLLITSDSLACIATSCGFCDQSHMTAQFTRSFGTTPRRYRLSHAQTQVA